MTNRISIFQVDAFTDTLFRGNPAAVCVLDEWPSSDLLQSIAAENYLPETAFIVRRNDGDFDLRWFTPDIEMDLCGHATLAAAHVLFKHVGHATNKIVFHSRSGKLPVVSKNGLLSLDFPSRMPEKAMLPLAIQHAFEKAPKEIYKSRDYVLVYDNEDQVRMMKPNRSVLDQINIDPGGIIITAPGNSVDFVSRFFTPQSTIFEDPVTGSAHCSLIPFWSERLNKKEMVALQTSAREGKLFCTNNGDRVLIAGYAKTFLEGFITI
jgi:PhzF family phenazine biosynthesis protein